MKLEEGNFKAAVRLVCSDDQPAQCSAETLAALKSKHPPAAVNRRTACSPNSSPRFDALQIIDSDVAGAIRSFPSGSAGGPDGITPQHLKDLTLLAPGVNSQLLDSLTYFTNMLLKGGLPVHINEVIFGGNMIALQKRAAA